MSTICNIKDKGEDLVALYNPRDLILYALSVGFGSQDNNPQNMDELKYLYENHDSFAAVPTFCLALSFWANTTKSLASSYEIPSFPPMAMKISGTIPRSNLRSDADFMNLSQYPIVHMWQSITWYRKLPVPGKSSKENQVCTRLKCRTKAITPKSIGTFVTSETQIFEEQTRSLLCTLPSTVLVLGIPKESVLPLGQSTPAKSKPIRIPKKEKPVLEWTFKTSPTQALFYRMASGDSNSIHAVANDNMKEKLGLSRPILHGLCTLGIATRAILNYMDNANAFLFQIEGRFTTPVFIGDTLSVRLWEVERKDTGGKAAGKSRTFAFTVTDQTTEEIAIDNGQAIVHIPDEGIPQKSRL